MWHNARGWKPCPLSMAWEHRRDKYRNRAKGQTIIWQPGTSILVPEYDPL